LKFSGFGRVKFETVGLEVRGTSGDG